MVPSPPLMSHFTCHHMSQITSMASGETHPTAYLATACVQGAVRLDNINLFSIITIMSFFLLAPFTLLVEGVKFTPSAMQAMGITNSSAIMQKTLLAGLCFHAYQQVHPHTCTPTNCLNSSAVIGAHSTLILARFLHSVKASVACNVCSHTTLHSIPEVYAADLLLDILSQEPCVLCYVVDELQCCGQALSSWARTGTCEQGLTAHFDGVGLGSMCTVTGAVQVSYMILQRVSPVTHSVGNCLKRVIVIVASVIVFQNPMSQKNMIGMTLPCLVLKL